MSAFMPSKSSALASNGSSPSARPTDVFLLLEAEFEALGFGEGCASVS